MRGRMVQLAVWLALVVAIVALTAEFSGADKSAQVVHRPAAPAVHHILLEVADLDRSIAFYKDQLGFKVTSRKSDFATLDGANVGVYLWTSRWDWEGPRKKGERLGLGMYPHLVVTDVKATTEHLKAAGYKIVQQPRHWGFGDEAFVADPDGYTWALINEKH